MFYNPSMDFKKTVREGYNVITLTDCTAAGSEVEQQIAVEKSYPMFSHPWDHKKFISEIK